MKRLLFAFVFLISLTAHAQLTRHAALLKAAASGGATGGTPGTPISTKLFGSPAELAIWQDRLLNGPFKEDNDYLSLAINGDYDTLKSRADHFNTTPSWERYTNYYTGTPPWPYGNDPPTYPFWSTGTRMRGLDAAAFYYYLSGDTAETYAQDVRDELISYATNNYLDWGNRTIFPIGEWGSQRGPYFQLASFVYRCLEAYDYTDSSAVYSESDHNTLRDWFCDAAEMYMLYNQYSLETSWLTGRQTNDYTFSSSSDPDTTDTSYGSNGRIYSASGYHYLGPYNHWFSLLWNNRQMKGQLMMFAVGVKYDSTRFLNEGIRTFKEAVAYGELYNGSGNVPDPDKGVIVNEFHRGEVNQPELGLSYASSILPDLIQMADMYARYYGTDLYDYTVSSADSAMYFGPNADKYWFDLYAYTGKSLKTMIDSFLKYYAGIDGYGIGTTSRHFLYAGAPNGQDEIDGHDYVNSVYRERDYGVWLANVYYQDDHIDSVINRQISGQRSPLQGETGVTAGLEGGDMGYWNGYWNTQNFSHFRFGNMAGQVFPYITADTIYFNNYAVQDTNRYVTYSANQGMYATAGATGAVDTSDFDFEFTASSMTAWTVDSVVHLAGGSSLTVWGSKTGDADGTETLEISPRLNSVYNDNGTPMDTAVHYTATFNAIDQGITNDSVGIWNGSTAYLLSSARETQAEPGNAYGLGNFYVDMWYKPDTKNTEGTMISNSDPASGSYQWYLIKWESDHATLPDYISFYLLDETGGYIEIRSSSALVTGSWHHIAVIVNGGLSEENSLKLFINGSEDTSAQKICNSCDTDSGINQDSDFRIQVGRRRAFSYYDGKLDEIWIQSGTLFTSSDVTHRYSGASKIDATAHPNWNASNAIYLKLENNVTDTAGEATFSNTNVTFDDDTF